MLNLLDDQQQAIETLGLDGSDALQLRTHNALVDEVIVAGHIHECIRSTKRWRIFAQPRTPSRMLYRTP
jgi:hypothetical protein